MVIPVRDGADVLHRQLDALAAQTFTGSWEVVIADNGSTDGSGEVAMRLERSAARPAGDRRIAAARRRAGPQPRAARSRTSEAVLFCDADDEASPDWVASMVAALGRHPIVGGPCQIEDPDGSIVPAPDKLGLTLGLVPFPLGGCFGVWRDVFAEVGGFETDHPEAQAEDAEFCLRAWELGHVAGFAPGALLTKRRRPDLRSTYRQWKGYGTGAMFNACGSATAGRCACSCRASSACSGGCSCTCPPCAPTRAACGGCDGGGEGRLGHRLPALPPAPGGSPTARGPGTCLTPCVGCSSWRRGTPDHRRARRSTASTSRPTPPSTASTRWSGGCWPWPCPAPRSSLFDDDDEPELLRRSTGTWPRCPPGCSSPGTAPGSTCPTWPPGPRWPASTSGLPLWADPTCRDDRDSLPGHAGTYRASWFGHDHLDAYRVYRADVGPALRIGCSLKTVARLAGLAPVEVDASRVHDLTAGADGGLRGQRRPLHRRAGPPPMGHRPPGGRPRRSAPEPVAAEALR